MKQTATEWLEEHFKTLIQEDKKGLYKLLFEQAKDGMFNGFSIEGVFNLIDTKEEQEMSLIFNELLKLKLQING